MKKLISLGFLTFLLFSLQAQQITSFQSKGKYGFSLNGKTIIAPQYEYAFDFSEGLALVKKDNKWGFIDSKNNLLIPFQFEKASSFRDSTSQVILDGKMGTLYHSGNVKLSNYPDYFSEYEGDTVIYNGKNQGYAFVSYSSDEYVYIPAKYKTISFIGRNFIIGTKHSGKIDLYKKNELIYPDIDKITETKKYGVYLIEIGDKKTLLNSDREVILELKLDSMKIESYQMKTNYYATWYYIKTWKNGVLDIYELNGEKLFESCSKIVSENSEFLINEKNGKHGILNLKNGKELKPEYDSIQISYPYVKVFSKGFVGLMDYELNTVLPINNGSIEQIDYYNENYGFDDFDVFESEEDIVYEDYSSYFVFSKNDSYGLINAVDKKLIIPLSKNKINTTLYSSYTSKADFKYLTLENQGKFGVFNLSTGKTFEPISMDSIAFNIDKQMGMFAKITVEGNYDGKDHESYYIDGLFRKMYNLDFAFEAFKEKGKYGFKMYGENDSYEYVVISPKFKDLDWESVGNATYIPVSNGKYWGVINLLGDTICPFVMYNARNTYHVEGWFYTGKKNKEGIYSIYDGQIIPEKYESIDLYSYDYITAKSKSHYEVYDYIGNMIFKSRNLPDILLYPYRSLEDTLYYYIQDLSKDSILPPVLVKTNTSLLEYKNIWQFNRLDSDNLYGKETDFYSSYDSSKVSINRGNYDDFSDDFFNEPIYTDIIYAYGSIPLYSSIIVKKDGKYGALDYGLDVLVEPEYDMIFPIDANHLKLFKDGEIQILEIMKQFESDLWDY